MEEDQVIRREDIARLLVNLADTAGVLAANRDEAISAVEQLTRLAQIQNDTVFEPHLAAVDRQIDQLAAILAEVDRDQTQLSELLFWLAEFADKLPLAVPDDFAQVYGLVEVVSE